MNANSWLQLKHKQFKHGSRAQNTEPDIECKHYGEKFNENVF